MMHVAKSYDYLGVLIDKADDKDLQSEPFDTIRVINEVFGPLMSIHAAAVNATSLQLLPDSSLFIAAAQAVEAFESFALDIEAAALVLNLKGVNAVTDADADVSDYFDLNGVHIGNGNSDTVFRLREGIDRFLVTDINNPGASAKAQSEIWTLYDRPSTQVSEFNHVPGGCNVLYMDGHVKFIRYPTEAPVSRNFANFHGEFDDEATGILPALMRPPH